jgi:hypothetical protein
VLHHVFVTHQLAPGSRGLTITGTAVSLGVTVTLAVRFVALHFGWLPADRADVRKVVLEESPTNLAINNSEVIAALKALFGSWEMHWLAFNWAYDLPGSNGPNARLPGVPAGRDSEAAPRFSRPGLHTVHIKSLISIG